MMPVENGKEKLKEAWRLISSQRYSGLAARLAGRSAAVGSGWCCMMAGVILTFTLCGAVIGVPLFAFGFLLVARGLF
jgi:hypothetical protein